MCIWGNDRLAASMTGGPGAKICTKSDNKSEDWTQKKLPAMWAAKF